MGLKVLAGAALLGLFLMCGSGQAEETRPLSEIIRAVEEQGYSPVEVEFEDGAWEITAAKDGKTHELTVDPQSGETLSAEEEDEADDDEAEPDQQEPAEDAAETPETPLSQLEWLIGEWVDQGADSTIKTKCDWTRHKHFLARTFSVETEGEVALEGTQVIAWDPVHQVIRSWMFDSEGGFSTGIWSRDGDHWNVKTTHTLATGERASAINVLTSVDENTIRWKSINREIEGNIQPSIPEVTIVRQAND